MLTKAEERERKTRIAAVAGTIMVHLLIVVALMFLAFRSTQVSQEEGSVEFTSGYNFDSTGDAIPVAAQTAAETNPMESTISPVGQKAEEKAVSLVTNKITTEKPKPVLLTKPKAIIETPDERTIIHKIPDMGKNTKSATGKPKTTAEGEANLKTDAATLPVKFDDKAGNGIGVWLELAGRGYISLPKPAIDQPLQGKISVSIIVNREGKVIFAGAAATGTTITDIRLRQRAENTARKTIFSSVKNAPDEQRGTIIYVFEKQK